MESSYKTEYTKKEEVKPVEKPITELPKEWEEQWKSREQGPTEDSNRKQEVGLVKD